MNAHCPCGQPIPYAACCEPIHTGAPAATAAALMRARYSAFVLGHQTYLLQSWHPSTRPATLHLDPDVKWLGLTVKAHCRTGAHSAEVEFVARSRRGGASAQRLQERSRFVLEDGHWFYLDGVIEPGHRRAGNGTEAAEKSP